MSATVIRLLEDLADRGVSIRRVDGQIACRPQRLLTADLIHRVGQDGAELLAELTPGGPAAVFGTVNDGWRPIDWATRLRQMAESCYKYHPERAMFLCAWAGVIERRIVGLTPVSAELSDDQLIVLREEFEERAAIVEYDGAVDHKASLEAAAEGAINLVSQEFGIKIENRIA